MNAIDLLLSPFYWLIKHLYLFGYELTGNYGLSIVLLSFSISLLLLPVFIFIEKAKKRNDTIRQKMKPLIDEIKRVYSGQERYYYIQTIYRQHNYSVFRAVFPILTLLVQIPFFIAAYKFLYSFAPLQGQGILFIKDLNQPDGLILGINLLPILMTLINIVSAHIYTLNGNTSERKQLYMVAGIFLLLLYNFPSGLVLYWTMNNLFSLLRLFFTNQEVLKKTLGVFSLNFRYNDLRLMFLKEKQTVFISFTLIFIIGLISQLQWAFNHSFNDFPLRIFLVLVATSTITFLLISSKAVLLFNRLSFSSLAITRPKTFYTLFFLSLYFYLAGKFYFTGINQTLLQVSLFFLIPLQIICISSVIYANLSKLKIIQYFVLWLLSVMLLAQILIALNALFGNGLLDSMGLLEISSSEDFITIGLLFSLISLPFYLINHPPKIVAYNRAYQFIYLLSSFYLVGYFFLWHPLLVFSSSVDTFSFPAVEIIKNNFILLTISLLALVLIFYILPRQFKYPLTFILLFLTVLSTVNSQILPLDLGPLHENRFADHDRLAAPLIDYFVDSAIIIALFWSLTALFKNHVSLKPILFSLIIINVFTIGHSLHKSIKTKHFFSEDILNTNHISFSKSATNIVFFIADEFQGKYIEQIMEDYPKIRENFNGFVWFPNTLSVSNYTHSSIPSLLGGNNYNVDWMNSDSTTTISEKITYVVRKFISSVEQQGYVLAGNKFYASRLENHEYPNFIPTWHPEWKGLCANVINMGDLNIWFNRLIENSIFQSVPLAFKPQIYNHTKWIFINSKIVEHDYEWHSHAFIKLLPLISDNNAKEPRFIYIHSDVCHRPWKVITDTGNLKQDVSPKESAIWLIRELNHWITWMKNNGVYDNTKIILVSDHGPSWYHYDRDRSELKNNITIDPNNPNKIESPEDFWNLQALLMVKDFNASAPFSINPTLMSNADAHGFAFTDNYLQKVDTTDRVVDTWWAVWEDDQLNQHTVKKRFHFKVRGNIYDFRNWERAD